MRGVRTGPFFFLGSIIPFLIILILSRMRLKYKLLIAGIYLIPLLISLSMYISHAIDAAAVHQFNFWETVGSFFQREWFWDGRYGGMFTDDVAMLGEGPLRPVYSTNFPYAAHFPMRLIRYMITVICLIKLCFDWWHYYFYEKDRSIS